MRHLNARVLPAIWRPAVAAAAVALCELVIWSGQPAGDPDGGTVLAYYRQNGVLIAAGDTLWIGALALLARSIWLQTATGRAASRLLRAASAPALVALAASAFAALSLVASARSLSAAQGLDAWRIEGALYEFGALALVVPVVLVLLLARRGELPVLGGAAAVVAASWILAGGLTAFLATILWFGVAAAIAADQGDVAAPRQARPWWARTPRPSSSRF